MTNGIVTLRRGVAICGIISHPKKKTALSGGFLVIP